jgi:hypothetical protein
VALPLAWHFDLLHSPTLLLYFEIGIGINLFITMAGLYLEQKYILRLKRPTYFFSYFWTAIVINKLELESIYLLRWPAFI